MYDRDEYAIKLESARFDLTKVEVNPAVLKLTHYDVDKTTRWNSHTEKRNQNLQFAHWKYADGEEKATNWSQVPRRIVIRLVDTEVFSRKF